MSDEKLSPERAVRLLRAKAAELEHLVKDDYESNSQFPTHLRDGRLTDLTAAISLIAELLADHIERSERYDEQLRQMYEVADRLKGAKTTDIDDANVRDMKEQRERDFLEGFNEGRPNA